MWLRRCHVDHNLSQHLLASSHHHLTAVLTTWSSFALAPASMCIYARSNGRRCTLHLSKPTTANNNEVLGVMYNASSSAVGMAAGRIGKANISVAKAAHYCHCHFLHHVGLQHVVHAHDGKLATTSEVLRKAACKCCVVSSCGLAAKLTAVVQVGPQHLLVNTELHQQLCHNVDRILNCRPG
jgi:hypothetical protein